MTTSRHLVHVAAALLLGLAMVWAVPAEAHDQTTTCVAGSPGCSCPVPVNGQCVQIIVHSHDGGGGGGGGDGGGGGGGGGPYEVCDYEVLGEIRWVPVTDPETGEEVEEQWAFVEWTCTEYPSGQVTTRLDNTCIAYCVVATPPPGGGTPAPPPETVRDTISAGLPPLPPPAIVSPDEPVVGMPAFLEVEGFDVRTASDTAFGYTIVVTATPTEVRWDFGGAERTCSAGGSGYTADGLERAMAQPDGLVDDGTICTWLFVDSSNVSHGGPVPSSVVTVWDYSWTLNGTDMGTFDVGTVSPATTFDLTVREFQAVITD